MNAETPKPQRGDRVRVSYEAEYVDEATALGPDGTVVYPVNATVEVLERADDPTLDPIWTVREVEPRPERAVSNIVVKFGDSYWLYPSSMGNGYGRLDWANVRESKVIGAVPGTPAAEAQTPVAEWEPGPRPSVRVPNEPLGIPLEVRQRIGKALVRGDYSSARLMAGHYMEWSTVDGYLSGMSEYQTYLAAHGEKREPRVFRSDGPEPPEDVKVLVWLDSEDTRDWLFLHRVGRGWLWSPDRSEPPNIATPNHWTSATRVSPGQYREVV